MSLNPVGSRLDQAFPWDREAIQPTLRKLMTVVENRLSPLEAKVIDWQDAVDQLTAVGLTRINDLISPVIISISELSDLGFMTAPSTYSVLLEIDTIKTWVIDAGPQRTNFKPTPFVYIQHNENIDDWAVGELLDYDSVTGELNVRIQYISVTADPGPHTNWTLSMSPAATPALFDALAGAAVIRDDVVEAQDDVVIKHADTVTKAAAAAASATAAAASAVAAALFDPSSYYTKTISDTRYYTQAASDTLLAGKAATSHTHIASQVTDFNTAAALAAFTIGDVLATARNPGGNFLPLDGAIKTTSSFTALQALLGNTYAQFTATLPTLPAGLFPAVVWESAFSLYMAGGTNGTTGALASSPDGVTWTSRDTTASRKWSLLASNGVKAMAINAAANTANCVITSNGTTWTAATSVSFADLPLENFSGGLLWLPAGSLWVAFSSGTTAPEIKTSANDGTSWTARTSTFAAGPDLPGAAAVGNGIIVQLAANAVGIWQTSTDGITWTRRTGGGWSSAANVQASIKFLNGVFIIGCVSGNRASVYTSADGITWTLHQLPYSLAPAGAYLSPISYLAPVYVFELVQFVVSSIPIDTIITTDFISWRRGSNNISPNVAGAYKSTVNAAAGVILFSAIGVGAAFPGVVLRATFDFNTATQFHVPLDDNILPPRWIRAL